MNLNLKSRTSNKITGRRRAIDSWRSIVAAYRKGESVKGLCKKYRTQDTVIAAILRAHIRADELALLHRSHNIAGRAKSNGNVQAKAIADTGNIVRLFKSGTSIESIRKQYRCSYRVVSGILKSKLGKKVFERIWRATRGSRIRAAWKAGAPKIHSEADDRRNLEAALASRRTVVVYECAGCGYQLPEKPECRCPKCNWGSFEKLELPQKLAV